MTAIAATTNIVSNAVMCPDWSISVDLKLDELTQTLNKWTNVFGFVQDGTSPGGAGNRIPALYAHIDDNNNQMVKLGFRSLLGSNPSYGWPQWDFVVTRNEWHTIRIEQQSSIMAIFIDGVLKSSDANSNPLKFDDVTGNFCEYGYAHDCFKGEYRNLDIDFGSCGEDNDNGDDGDDDGDDVGDDGDDDADDDGDDVGDDGDDAGDDAEDNGMSVTCMNGDLVHMTATVSVDKVQMDLSETDDWSLDSGNNVYTKSWTAADFDSSEISVDESDNLVLTKSISAPCKDEEVDGISVCVATGHSLDFQCKYPLGTRTVHNDLNVSGHDANVDAEGVGELKYTLSVADGNVEIGEPVEVTITPANPNLVFAQLNDCNVEYNSASVSILNYGAGSAVSWNYKANSFLGDWSSHGSTGFDTLEEAQTKCLTLGADDCGGITKQSWVTTGVYQLRRDDRDGHTTSPSGEESWRREPSTRSELAPVCEIGASVGTASGKTDLTFDWKAFKWATATKDAVEQQTISCTITLSKDDPDFDVGSCPN